MLFCPIYWTTQHSTFGRCHEFRGYELYDNRAVVHDYPAVTRHRESRILSIVFFQGAEKSVRWRAIGAADLMLIENFR